MFCSKCGTEVTEGTTCPSCGNNVNNGNTKPIADLGNMIKDKKINSKTIIIAAAVVIILFLGILIASNHKRTLDLNQYLTVEFEGYDTLGRAVATFDWEAFENDHGGKIKADQAAIKAALQADSIGLFSNDDINAMADYYANEGALEIIESCINGSLDQSSGLSNGDQVIYQWDCNEEELSNYYKVKLNYEDMTFTASGFEQVGTFNPFDDFSINYSGTAPNGNAVVASKGSGDEYYSLNYSLSKSDGLSNGDQITVNVSINGSEENYVEKYGKLPSPTEQTFTVDGLMSYITTAADIPDELLTQMQRQAEDKINSYIAQEWVDELSLKELSYLGNYYLQSKGNRNYSNRCCLVYKITAEATMETESDGVVTEEHDSYYFVQFSNLMLEADGKGAVDISSYTVPYDIFSIETEYIIPDSWFSPHYKFLYDGYDSLEKLYNEVVTKNLENYSYENNVTE